MWMKFSKFKEIRELGLIMIEEGNQNAACWKIKESEIANLEKRELIKSEQRCSNTELFFHASGFVH